MIGPQVHDTDFQPQETLLNKIPLVVGGIVQHKYGVAPPVPLEAVEVLDKPAEKQEQGVAVVSSLVDGEVILPVASDCGKQADRSEPP